MFVLLEEVEEDHPVIMVEEVLLLDRLLPPVNPEVYDERSRLALFVEAVEAAVVVAGEVVMEEVVEVEPLQRLLVDPGVYDEREVVFLA